MTQCPNCKTDRSVRPSQKKKLLLELPRLLGLRPFRCDACGTRFYRYPSIVRKTSDTGNQPELNA